MYYHNEVSGVFSLMMTERASVYDPWVQGTPISELNAWGNRLTMPRLAPDELSVVFNAQDIGGGDGGYDMWMAVRENPDSPFGDIRNLSELNTAANEGVGTLTPDGLTLYFASDRDGSMQIFRAIRESLDSPFGSPVHLSVFDIPGRHVHQPWLASDGSALYFESSVIGNRSTRDIWVSYNVVPLPSAFLLGTLGLSFASWRLWRRTARREGDLEEAAMKRGAIFAGGFWSVLVLIMASTCGADLFEGLVACYSFDGNANDVSGHGHDGAVCGIVGGGATLTADRFGRAASAYAFDGVDDYINVAYSDAFQTADYTLAAWICLHSDLSSGTGGEIVAGRGEDFDTDKGWSWLSIGAADDSWGTGLRVGYETNSDTDLFYHTGVFPERDRWTHVAATRSTDGEITIYKDGTVIGHWTSTPAPTDICAQDLTIGARWTSPGVGPPYDLAGYFEGSLDEIRLYDRALSTAEIQELVLIPTPGAVLLGTIGVSYAAWRLRKRKGS
jgi:hypothetical protein